MAPTYSQSKLARCYRNGNYIYFSIGKAADFYATLDAFKERVPGRERRYDKDNKEWRIPSSYGYVLDELFANYPAILNERGARSHTPTGNRTTTSSTQQYHAHSRSSSTYSRSNNSGWPAWIIIGIFCVGVWIWFNAGNSQPSSARQTVQATSASRTSVAAAPRSTNPPNSTRQAQPTEIAAPTAAVSFEAVVLRTANLHYGPGTNYSINGQLSQGTKIYPNAQVIVPSSYSWYRLPNGLWIYSQLVGGPTTPLPIITPPNPIAQPPAPTRLRPTATARPYIPPQPTAAPRGYNHGRNLTAAQVTRVVDGDTIYVSINGRSYKLRYIGMDTPERGRTYYREATDRNAQLVSGQTVYLEKDVSETGPYGRLLRYVYLADGRMVNEMLVREGYAKVATYPPDVKYVQRFRDAQSVAQNESRGLWR